VARILLLTGVPGIGMTTAVRRVGERLAGRKLGGFFTDEIRVDGVRQGFRISTFDGREDIFAHRDIESPVRVGGYGIDVGVLDRVADRAFVGSDLYLVDEIGKMECCSERLVSAIRTLVASTATVVATVSLKADGLVEEIKKLPNAPIWKVTRETRDGLPDRILRWLQAGGP
jgi:nucleoside-triphosphatase